MTSALMHLVIGELHIATVHTTLPQHADLHLSTCLSIHAEDNLVTKLRRLMQVEI